MDEVAAVVPGIEAVLHSDFQTAILPVEIMVFQSPKQSRSVDDRYMMLKPCVLVSCPTGLINRPLSLRGSCAT